jgi:hypothetical protein
MRAPSLLACARLLSPMGPPPTVRSRSIGCAATTGRTRPKPSARRGVPCRVGKYGLDLPSAWGSPTIWGPIVTASGLIFIGASMDRRVRALDLRSGRVLRSFPLEAVPNPSTFVPRAVRSWSSPPAEIASSTGT